MGRFLIAGAVTVTGGIYGFLILTYGDTIRSTLQAQGFSNEEVVIILLGTIAVIWIGVGLILLSQVLLKRWGYRFVLPFARIKGQVQRTGVPTTVEIGGKTLSTSSLYKLDDLPKPDEIMKHARKSVYFVGDSLHYLINQYSTAIEEYAGELKLRFLVIMDDSPIGQAILKDSDPSKIIAGQRRNTVSSLRRIREKKLPGSNLDVRARQAWFEVRGYKQLPFSMVLVDVEDREHGVIQIGYYTQGSPSGSRPTALVSPKSELYDVLLKTYETAWENGGGDRPVELV